MAVDGPVWQRAGHGRAPSLRERIAFSLLATLLALQLSGCGDEQSSTALVSEGRRLFNQGDYKSAAIHLRNAVSRNPLDREALVLLGQTYASLGNHDAAATEFSKVWRLGTGNLDVAESLARSYLGARKYDELLRELKPESSWPAPTAAAVLSVRGKALTLLKRQVEALRAYREALELEPEQPAALLGLAGLARADGDIDGTFALIERALARSPRNLEAWMMKGDLLMLRERHAEAAAAYQSALGISPDHLLATIGLAHSLIATARLDEARNHIEAAARRHPDHAMVHYARALLHHAGGDIASAQESIALALKHHPDYVPALVLSGSIDLRQGSYARAAVSFGQVVKARQADPFARALLATALIRTNRGSDALAALQPALVRVPDDRDLLVLAAEANMLTGRYTQATELFERASRLDPKDAEARRGIALARLAMGDDLRATKELDAAMRLGGRRAEVMLAMTLLGQRQFEKALAAARSLQAKDGQNPIPHFVSGLARLGLKDIARARVHLEQALALDGKYFPAARELARLDFSAGKVSAARDRFTGILALDKTNLAAMLSLSELNLVVGLLREGVAWLEKARVAAPQAVEPRIRLARHYVATGELDLALAVAAEAEALQPDHPDVLQMLGTVRLAQGDVPNALAALSRLVRNEPKSHTALYHLAAAQAQAGRHVEADGNFARALALRPDYIDAMVARAMNLAAAGRVDEALKVAAEVKSRYPKRAVGPALEGDVLLVAKRPVDAVKAYQAAVALENSSPHVIKQHLALDRAGRKPEAEALLRERLARQARDIEMRLRLADWLAEQNRNAEAASEYERALGTSRELPRALNNLAIVYQRLKDSRALSVAERAHKLRPKDPAIADTYGWILVEAGRVSEGVSLLDGASRAAPKSAEFRYHYALALARAGDKPKARAILERIAAEGGTFVRDPEAEKYLQ